MAEEVATIVRLVFPGGERKEFEFSIPLAKSQLPPSLWKETDDHFRGVFNRVGESNVFEFSGLGSREDAIDRGIPCY